MPGTELARYIPPFLKKIFSQENFIHKLPLDIWIDWIIPYLTIEDVICLRRVNKTLFLITHEPIIWKRFLVRMPIPIPPLRPSLRWSWDLTSFQIEQIVAKAVAADDNWRRLSPKFGHARVIYAFYEVLEMKILPGGQYMVASVTHKSSRRFYICLFSLDHSDNMAPPLARLPVPAKVYGLEARFLRWKGGRPGIMIMYSQRSPQDGQSYGWVSSLELLADPTVVNDSEVFRERAKALPTPFQFVIHFVSNAHTEHHSLFEVDGKPFAAVVQKPNEVVIMDLTSSQLSSIKCLRIPEFNAVRQEHKIRAIRVLPKQNQVLVVRTLRLRKLNEKLDQHTVELYTLPDAGVLGLQSEPDQYFLIENRNAMSIHLSDHYEPLRGRDHPLLHDPYGRPPPITIYVCGEQLEGMEVINVEPDLNPTANGSTT
ncbi:hypothetical protein BDP27DRAFT_1226033 [Rhodocollybia butyracea]|uniref:F-box domain-containing protein n=1 Tax=Rhodocollybia butyracea TaxID=206335 RepID=A0A9P5PNY0_9AGAR|nr:hypothetical protein BDP27DRAFT_1226033 [Rhodocollybia butyracea]